MSVAQSEEGRCIFISVLLAPLCLFKKVKEKVVSMVLPYLVVELTYILMSRGEGYTFRNYSLHIFYVNYCVISATALLLCTSTWQCI